MTGGVHLPDACRARARERTVATSSAPIFSQRRVAQRLLGEGPERWVGLHGWGGSHATFARLARELSGSIRAFDLPGYGDSTTPTSFSLDAIARAVATSLPRAEGGRRWGLVGNCSGAIVALWLYRAEPARFDRLVLVEPFDHAPWYFALFGVPFIGRALFRLVFANPVGRRVTARALERLQPDGSMLRESFADVTPRVASRYMATLRQARVEPWMAEIDVPITLVRARSTFAAVEESVSRWAALWPHANQVVVDAGGHLLLQQRPEVVALAMGAEASTPMRRAKTA